MILFIQLDYSNIIMTVFTVLLTSIVGVAANKINNHYKRREEAEKEAQHRREQIEKQNQRRQELHFMKIDAVIYAIAASSDAVHSEIFVRKYDEHLKKLIEDNRLLNELEDDN